MILENATHSIDFTVTYYYNFAKKYKEIISFKSYSLFVFEVLLFV